MAKKTDILPAPTRKTPRVVQLGFTRSGLALAVRCIDVALTDGQLNEVDQNEATALRARFSQAYQRMTS